jgi:hypothetical protein
MYFKADYQGLKIDDSYELTKLSRPLCNYLERNILDIHKYKTDGFSRMVFCITESPTRRLFVNSEKVAIHDVGLSINKFKTMLNDPSQKAFIALAKQCFMTPEFRKHIPDGSLTDGVDSFVASGMESRWIHSDYRDKKSNISALAICSMTRKSFKLSVEISIGDKISVKEQILETDPDENAFKYKLGKFEKAAHGRIRFVSKYGDFEWVSPRLNLK